MNPDALVVVAAAVHDSGPLPPDMCRAADLDQVRSKHTNNPEGDAGELDSSLRTPPDQDPLIQCRPSEKIENND